MIYLLDYHIHPGYSIDAEDQSILEYCQRALKLELKEICFTPHLEVDPVRRQKDWFVRVEGKFHPMEDLSWLDNYFFEIENARNQLRSTHLKIKAGVEIGYIRGCEERIEKIITSYPFDYVLGSIHCLAHQSISSWKESQQYFSSHTVDEALNEYFQILQDAVNCNLFDCIAHLDLYRRHGERFWGKTLIDAHQGKIEPILKDMARKKIGLEVNTSSIKRGLSEFHPSREILFLAREYGVKVFTVGSDAHRLSELGAYIKQAIIMLKEMGLAVYTFTARQPCPL
ncbi:histidinol-phosphatase (PHP family) [Desulfofundulus australicus DSM 11792]|uniref:Histidinol-phosphatase n=1 Tax=Desulfofundulus australicus DSM 11792 TaxID=1121425 RepID=A0A1M5BUF3_9FIRM|nr:histidinol-phosphatase [Desulfofundulus australicus]SHF46193.1 histidinol-phosphatase (PHP family) [Desulfofundulus australicus DSM 11792]